MLPEIKKNVSLKDYTTFKIGGKASYFCTVRTRAELPKVLEFAKDNKLPFFVLGGGSNLLVSDKGFLGVVIKMQNTEYKIQGAEIFAGAGIQLGQLLNIAKNDNLSGLEWAAGIPGTLGGAIFGNAGTPKESISDCIKGVEFFDSKNFEFSKFEKKYCKFGYRDSVFKHINNLTVVSALLELQEGNKTAIESKIRQNLNKRKENQPLDFPSAGSVFKNPKGFSAAKLIEECGLKGKRFGNVEISKKHANFIVNLGGGKSADAVKLINLAKLSTKKMFDVDLEEEIQYLGF